ncbi:MAG: BatA domain-containing protein [Pirellulales bacterium]
MDFVNPALLAGAAAAAAPIILHLVMRQQPRHLEFPALRFIQVRQDANRRRLKLRHLLLLLLRCAAVCLLAAALARPSVKASGVIGDQEAPVAAALVFDTAPRMDYRHQNQTRLEVARDIGLWLAGQLPPDSQLAVIDSRRGEAAFQVDLGSAQDRIKRLETDAVARPLVETLEQSAELLRKSELERKELYVFTDLAQAAWKRQGTSTLAQRLAKLDEMGIYIIDVGVEKPQNFALGEVHLSSEVLPRSRPWTLACEVMATQPGARVVQAYLVDSEGKPQKKGEETVEADPQAPRPVEFAIGGLETGTHQGYLRLVGSDGLAADDRRWFTIEVKPPWPVLVVAPSPSEARADSLTRALAPPGFRRTGQARWDCQVVSPQQLGQQPLESFPAVALVDPPPLSEEMWSKLHVYVQDGGSLAIFLGPSAQPPYNGVGGQELLAGALGIQARFPDGNLHVVTGNEQHPMLARFRPLRGSVPWDAFPVYRHWQLEPVEQAAAVLNYSNNRPAVLERVVGKGRALTMTTPVEARDVSDDNRWNRLPVGFEPWPFVMLMDQMFQYLVGSTDGRLNYAAGETAVLRIASGRQFSTYLVTTPRGDSFRQSADASEQSIVITGTERPGNYRVRAGGASGGIDRGFSVNIPAEASDLTRLDEQQLKQIWGDADFRLARNREQIDREVNTGRVGRELFGLLIAVVALVLSAEHVLSNRFYRERAQPRDRR